MSRSFVYSCRWQRFGAVEVVVDVDADGFVFFAKDVADTVFAGMALSPISPYKKGDVIPAAKITEEITRCISEALGAGHYREVACKLAGIDRKTLLNWLKRGERDRSGVYRDLYLAVEQVEVFHLKNIETASVRSWFALEWLLEWKHPERWGMRETPPADDREGDEVVVIGQRVLLWCFGFLGY